MTQLEQKIDTARYNLNIKRNKELTVLEKEINLHVSDIKRIQGLISRLGIMKGKSHDELRRTKDKARKTMEQLKVQKKIHAGQFTKTARTGTLAKAGSTVMGDDDMLFSGLKKPSMMSSMGGSMSSTGNYMQTVLPLKLMLEQRPLTDFEIAATSVNGKKPINVSEDKTSNKIELQAKIKTLLSQRKPPTEKLPELCDLYDDDLNPVA
jgi:hypothetical protein